MQKEINIRNTLYEISIEYPEIIAIMSDLGFEHITKPGMLQTAGKIMTIPKGCRMRGIPLHTVKQAFQNHGFIIKEED